MMAPGCTVSVVGFVSAPPFSIGRRLPLGTGIRSTRLQHSGFPGCRTVTDTPSLDPASTTPSHKGIRVQAMLVNGELNSAFALYYWG
jgi:hypothetical protein